ncbi:MAG TPA: hypothetical protein PK794_04460, partial [Armatimonadota bacterium]|nr:hypothetical protein [Armatimonadota bacterium]
MRGTAMLRRMMAVLFLCSSFATVGALRASAQAAPGGGKIGIFDLPAIHATPLAPEILTRTEEGNIITEEVRFTSVPGVRVFGYYSYPKGGKKLPGVLLARYVGAESRKADAKNGFVGFSIAAPNANADPAKKESLGGAPFNQNFTDDPTQSWVYHHVVALTRALDYMASRPETDMKRVVVMGYSWAGYITALLHGIDNRPCAYVSWHGTGYYADAQGLSGDKPSLLGSRRYYEMYAPSAY